MATVSRPTTPLPSPGDEMVSEQVTDWINNILDFIESNSIDEGNINLTSATGVMGLSTAQAVKGLKTFTSTATSAGAKTAINFALHPADNTISTNDGVRTAYQIYDSSAGSLHDFGYIDCIATDLTTGSEDGKFIFSLYKDGTATEAFTVTGDGPTFNGNVNFYEDANGADVTISLGTSATESFNIIADNGSGNKTLEKVIFRSKTDSGTANHGHMSFEVDQTEIATIKDDGIHAVVGGVKIADDKTLTFGSDGNYTVEYDEDGTDKLIVSSAVDGAALSVILQADRGDDAGDEWLLNIADGGVLTLANDKASAGTHANGKLTLTASATASVLDFGGNATLYNDLNNADVSLAMGTSATESFNIITSNGASDKELYQVDFTTKTAEADADRGKFVFNVDEVNIATIDDDGLELASGKTITAPSLTSLGLLYSNSGVVTALSGITTDGSTLRVGASGGSAGATLQVYGNTNGSYVTFSSSDDAVTYQKYGVVHLSNATNTPVVQIKNTYNDATAGTLKFINDRGAAGQDNDLCGTIAFFGDDDNQDNIQFAKIEGVVADASNGDECGALKLYVAENDGNNTVGISITGSTSDGVVNAQIGAGSASTVTIPGSIDLEGDVDVNGTLEADAITLGGTALGSLYSPVAGSSSIVTTGTISTGTWAATDVAVAHGGTGSSNASDARTALGVAIGSDVQAYDADLAAIGALAKTDSNFIVGNGSTWVAEGASTARSSLGLGTMAVADTGDYSVVAGSSSIVTVGTISTGTWQGTAIASAYLDSDTAHLSGTQTFTGAKTFTAGVTVGVDGTGHDVQIFGDTSGSSVLFDESADDMVLTNYGIAVGSDATGDIYYRNASGFLARLGKGTAGHYLKQGSSIPEWAAVSAGGSAEYNAWAIKTTTYTASTKDQLIANHASTAFTITLPSSPSAGNTVTIKNVGAATVTIGRNSEKINSEAADGTLFTGSAVQLVYVDSTIGWTTL